MKKIAIDKKILMLVLILVSALIILLIIVSKDTSKKNNKTSNEPVKFQIWTIYGDSGTVLERAIAQYKKEHPEMNVDFEITIFKNEVYKDSIANAVVNDTLPDMFFFWGYEKFKNLADAGLVLDITDKVNKKHLQDMMLPNVLDGFMSDGRIYGLPMFGWKATLFCNREIFEKYNVHYPTTYDELCEAVKTFNKNDITPLSCGIKELWLPSIFYMSFVLQDTKVSDVLKIESSMKEFAKLPYVEAAKKLEDLNKLNPWQDDWYSYDAYSAVYYFEQNQAAMLLGGSWTAKAVQDDGLAKDKVDAIAFPNNGTKQGVGGYVDSFFINSKGKMAAKDEYVDIYIDLMQQMSDLSVNEYGIGLPVYMDQGINEERFPLMKQCENIDYSNGMHPAYDQILHTEEAKKYYDCLSEILLGELTYEQFIDKLTKN